MTPDELASEFAQNGEYGKLKDLSKQGGPTVEQQHELNRIWLNEQFRILKVGGIWAWPDTLRIFKKVDQQHFREVGVGRRRIVRHRAKQIEWNCKVPECS